MASKDHRTSTGRRNKRRVKVLLQQLFGEDFNPVVKMAENAMALQKLAEDNPTPEAIKDAASVWKDVSPYVEPKLSATQVDASVDLEANVVTSITVKEIKSGD